MAFCTKCGKPIPDGQTLCDQCAPKQNDSTSFFGTGKDETGRFDSMDIQNNKVLAVLSYIGIFVLIPIFAGKNSPYARYHANQGLVLFLAEIIWWVFCSVINLALGFLDIFGPLFWIIHSVVDGILGILSLAFLALVIYGIVNAVTGKAKPLPFLGRFTLLH